MYTSSGSGDPNRPYMTVLPGGPIRLNSIKGHHPRTNNVIYCPPLIKSPKDQTPGAVIYFGGDVQDVPENMEGNRDTKTYMKYNLENTAVLLRETFPKFHIIVVQPSRMEYTTFSCFDNFVRGNCAGIPDHTPMHYALQHLEELLSNISQKLTKLMSEAELISKLTANYESNNGATSENQVQQPGTNKVEYYSTSGQQEMDIDILQVPEVTIEFSQFSSNSASNNSKEDINSCSSDSSSLNNSKAINNSSPLRISTEQMQTDQQQEQHKQLAQNEILWWRDTLNFDKCNLALVGFSKGCVVLNQFIYEFHYLKTLTPDDSSMMRLVSRIKDMYWLDGGHGGGKNTWITSRSLLETLCRLNINIHVHVTPYQVQDDHRPWIRKEEKAFTDMLKRLGANILRHVHSPETNISNLFTHFEVLHGFKRFNLALVAQQQQHQQAVAALAAQQCAAAENNNKNCSKSTESPNSSPSEGSSGEESETDK